MAASSLIRFHAKKRWRLTPKCLSAASGRVYVQHGVERLDPLITRLDLPYEAARPLACSIAVDSKGAASCMGSAQQGSSERALAWRDTRGVHIYHFWVVRDAHFSARKGRTGHPRDRYF